MFTHDIQFFIDCKQQIKAKAEENNIDMIIDFFYIADAGDLNYSRLP